MFNLGAATGYLKLNTAGWSGSMRTANTSLAGLQRNFVKFGAVALGSLVLIEREFGRFDKAIRHATSVSDTTTAQFDEMSKMALDASVRWNKAATETAQAFYYLGSAGLTVTEQMQAFNDTIMLSRAMGSELSMTVEGLVDIVRAFNLDFADTSAIADQLTQTVITSNQVFSDLDKAMSYVSSTARFTNNTLAETAAMVGVMANAGIKGSMAGTILRRAFANLMSPTAEMRELIYSLGVNIYDATGKMRPYIEIMGQINDSLSTASDEYKNLVFRVLFGVRAIGGQIALFNEGSSSLRRYANSIRDAGGATEKVAGKQMAAFSEVLGKLWQQIRRISIVVGDKLAPSLEKVANQIRYNMEIFEEYITQNGVLIAQTLKWITVIGSVLVIGLPLLTLVSSLAINLIKLSAVIANPWAILIASLYTLRAVWKQTSDDIIEKARKTAEAVAYESIGPAGIMAASTAAGAVGGLMVGGHIGAAVGAAGGLVLGAFEARRASKAFQEFVDAGRKPAIDLKEMWAVSSDAVKKQIMEDFGSAAGFVDSTMENTTDTVSKLWDDLRAAIKGIHNIFNIFMRKQPAMSGLQMAVDARKMYGFDILDEGYKRLLRLHDEEIAKIHASIKVQGIWSTRWQGGIRAVVDATENWQNVFAEVNANMKTEWADTIYDFMDNGGVLKNFMDEMFKGILQSFNKMVSGILANDLWYSLFGQGKGLPFGAATIFHGGSVAQSAYDPAYMDSLSGMLESSNYSRIQSQVPELGLQPNFRVAIKNEGPPVVGKVERAATFDGKDWVVNVMLEAYETDPNVRERFGK